MLIEAGTSDEANRWLAGIATHPRVLSFVAYADPLDPGFDDLVLRWLGTPKLRGFRFRLEGIYGPEVPQGHKFVHALSVLRNHDLAVELLLEPIHLSAVARALGEVPGLTAVIEHLAKPDFAASDSSRERQQWNEGMAALSELPSTVCKLSLSPRAKDFHDGKLVLASQWEAERIAGHVRFAFDRFGASRCCWGSDWPISSLMSEYAAIIQKVKDSLAPTKHAELAAVLHGTARRVYGQQGSR